MGVRLAVPRRIGWTRAQSFGALGALAWARLQTGDAAGARDAVSRWEFVAPRLALRVALARVTGDAVHMEAARALIDEIAASVGDASGLGAGFRAAALEELAAAGAPAPS